VFVDDVTDKLLHQVFEGDDSRRAAVLVDHHCQLQASFLQPVE
jgi:hypothetical protein